MFQGVLCSGFAPLQSGTNSKTVPGYVSLLSRLTVTCAIYGNDNTTPRLNIGRDRILLLLQHPSIKLIVVFVFFLFRRHRMNGRNEKEREHGKKGGSLLKKSTNLSDNKQKRVPIDKTAHHIP